MRVVLAVSEYHRRGGFPRAAADYAVGLNREGHDVLVHARDGKIEARPDDHGIEFRPYRTPPGPTLLHMATEPLVVGRLLREAAEEADLVCSVGIPCLAPVVLLGPGTHRAFYLRTRRALPTWSLRRWGEVLRPFHRVVLAWERAMLARPHPRLVVVPDDAHARQYVDLFDFPADRIVRVPYPVNLEEFRFDAAARRTVREELGVPDGVPMLLNIARRGRQKGLDVLARALDGLPDDLEFLAVFAGDGSTSRALQTATGRLRGEGRARLLGRVPEVRPLYCAADLLVFPSRYDPWGLVVTEALACGLQVVCSGNIGAAQAVRDGETGALLDDSEDVDQVREAVLEMLHKGPADRQAVARSVEWLGREAVARRLVEATASPDGEMDAPEAAAGGSVGARAPDGERNGRSPDAIP